MSICFEMIQQNKISEKKIEKYMNLTTNALEKVRSNVIKGKEKEAKEIIEMVENYLSDAKHFLKEGDYVNSFAALNYSHGWIDCGVRTDIFDVDDDRLFTVK